MHLEIKQANDRTEQVSSTCIDKLYNLSKNDSLDATSDLRGNINAASAYEDAVTFLNTMWGPNLIVTASAYYIRFADPEVESVLKTALNKGEGEGITTQEAANTFANYFQNNTDIESFDELKYFARNSWLSYNFRGCSSLKSIDITDKEDKVDCLSNTSVEYFYGINGPKGFLSTNHNGSNFNGCQGITTLELKCSSNMQTNAYTGMSGLQTLIWKVSPGVSSGHYSFDGAPLLERVIVDDLDSFWTHDMSDGYGSPFSNGIAKLIVNDVEVTSVTVPQTITRIQPGNWYKARLTSCTFHSNITSIGNWAFADCDNLVILDLNLPNLTTLGSGAFEGTKVQTISNLGSITSVPYRCFRNCSQLTTIPTLNNIISIGDAAFDNCSNLSVLDLNLPNLTSIGSYAFANTGIQRVTNLGNITTIPNGVFEGCSQLAEVTLSNSITAIDAGCFRRCYNLATINGGLNITKITSYVTDIPFINNKTGIVTLGKVVFGCGTIANDSDVIIPDGIVYLAGRVFRDKPIKSVYIPDTVTGVSGGWGGGVFSYCRRLSSVRLSQNLTNIGDRMFQCCDSLTQIDIPESVTNIEIWAFDECPLQTLIVRAETPPILNKDALSSSKDPTSIRIYVPANSVQTYKSASVWSTYANQIEAIPTT